jgi:hypothetical protein
MPTTLVKPSSRNDSGRFFEQWGLELRAVAHVELARRVGVERLANAHDLGGGALGERGDPADSQVATREIF